MYLLVGDSTHERTMSGVAKQATAARQFSIRNSGAACLGHLTDIFRSASSRERTRALVALREIAASLPHTDQMSLVSLSESALNSNSSNTEQEFASVDLLATIGGNNAKAILHSVNQIHSGD
jgi:hypothetical protein